MEDSMDSRRHVAGTVTLAGVLLLAALGAYLVFSRDAGASSAHPNLGPTGKLGAAVVSHQPAILADGKVTPEELEIALTDYRVCGEALGYTAIVRSADGLRPTLVNFGYMNREGLSAEQVVRRAQNDLAMCRTQTLTNVTDAWMAQQGTPDAAVVSDLYDRLSKCVAAGGAPWISDVEGRASFSWVQYPTAPSAGVSVRSSEIVQYLQCALQVQADTGWPAPPPIVTP